MPFQVELSVRVRRQIASWQLSDFLLVETYLRLQRDLAKNPAQVLVRVRQPFDGMCFFLSLVDPENRLREHMLVFQVFYSQNEEKVIVAWGGYQRREGL